MSIYDQIPQGSPTTYLFQHQAGDPLKISGSLETGEIVLRELKGQNISKEEYDTALFNLATQINFIGRGTFPQLKTGAYTPKQTSVSDATVGSLLTVGGGGIMGNAILNNNWDTIAVSGLYHNSITTATGIPEVTANLGLIHHNVNATTANQLAFKPSTGTPSMWRRAKVSGVWGGWTAVALGADVNVVGAAADYALSRTSMLEKDIQKNYISLEGPRSFYTGLVTSASYEYIISNYDAFSRYSVATSFGQAAINNNKIVLSFSATPPTEVILTVKRDGYEQGFLITRVDPAIVGVCLVNDEVSGGSWAHIDSSGNPVGELNKQFFDAHPVWGGIQDQIIDGQHMVKIPQFSVKVETLASGPYTGKSAWFIAPGNKSDAGFSPHSAFYWGGSLINQFWFGKYAASLDGSKLSSVPGVMPAVSRTLIQFNTDAAARNTGGVTGFMQNSFHQNSAIQWLYLVECATMDSQAKTGRGRVDTSSAALVDAPDVAQATYRGMIGLWGNVWRWAVGMQIEAGRIWVWNENQQLVDTGHTIPNPAAAYKYPKTFSTGFGTGFNLAHSFLAATNQTGLAGATCQDGHYFTTETARALLLGGLWHNASRAGLWCAGGLYDASLADTGIGSRLAKV